jgi:hypothetical protein
MWLIYWLLGLLTLWLGDFTKKALIRKGWDKDVYLFVCFIFYTLILWTNYFLSSHFIIDSHLLRSALIIGFFDFLTPIWLLTALKYLDTSLTFISIRILSSFLILYIWIYILWDQLSIYNIVWFFFWVIAIFFLSWFSFKEKHSIHKKWFLAVVISIIWITWAHSYFKYIVQDINIPSYVFFKFLVSFFFLILYMVIRRKFHNFNRKEVQLSIPYAITSCFLFSIFFLYIIPNIYILWPLSLWYKILSYSILVPIILSIIIYKEQITKKKILAFILTIISIILFVK